MNQTLESFVLEDLSANGTWRLTDDMKSALRCQISHLPRREVSDDETRYPQTPGGMRAFLVKFFARHYLQTQDSLIEYMTSQQFVDIARSRRLRILDIGSGPAVASLAITNMVARILDNLRYGNEKLQHKVKVDYVLNDTSSICLGTAQRMLTDYSHIVRRHNNAVIQNQTLSIQRPFPDNINQLERIASNLGTYDITVLSYVISPLSEDKGFGTFVNGLSRIEQLCTNQGRILILQDRFQEALVRQVSESIGVPMQQEEATQEIYPKRNDNETYTYSYFRCLYAPR